MSFRYAKQKPKYGFIPQNLLGSSELAFTLLGILTGSDGKVH